MSPFHFVPLILVAVSSCKNINADTSDLISTEDEILLTWNGRMEQQ